MIDSLHEADNSEMRAEADDLSPCIQDFEGLDCKVVIALKEKNLILTTAESCTGGMIASAIVNVGGASNVFHEGYITYCDEAKMRILGVKEETLKKYKAVSAETACEMAQGALRISHADIAVSVTGVAGPSMEDGKPVGLVYIGCSYSKGTRAVRFHFKGDRAAIRYAAAKEALKLVLETIKS